MTVHEMIKALELTVIADTGALEETVAGGYVSDLLSHVMGQAKAGQIWVTMQGHQNIVAVASLVGLGAVIVAGGIEPEEQTIVKARDQDGHEVRFKADGFLARVIQHEIDHLNGVLLVDHLSPVQKLALAGRLKRLKKQSRIPPVLPAATS